MKNRSGARLEILMAAVNQDKTLLDKINLESDIIVCNQSNSSLFNEERFQYGTNNVTWFNFNERGVGLNRNNALMRSQADICLIGDDDVTYKSGYSDIVVRTFDENPKADVILFNVHPNENYHPFVCKKKMRINFLNCGRFGGVRIAFRRTKVIKHTISFNLMFGGGAMFGAGEDVMFIEDCLRNGLKVIAVPNEILTLREERESTWFNGYDDKFFHDMGASYVYHYGRLALLIAYIQLLRHKKEYLTNYSFKRAVSFIKSGIKTYRNL